MSPAIRDLKGRPIEETASSRDPAGEGPFTAFDPGGPVLGTQLVEREAIRQAVEKVQSLRAQREPHPDDVPLTNENVRLVPVARVPLPADMEAGLADSEASLEALVERVGVMREQISAIRARAGKDAGKLARLAELLKQMGE